MVSEWPDQSTARLATRRRLLRDIAELQEKPYPNITLHVVDLTRACLVLTPEYYAPLHLTVHFHQDYPLSAPRVTIESNVRHPNVHGHVICASILSRVQGGYTPGYTPAYTLKGICIQLLSFFNSDSIDQYFGSTNIREYRENLPMRHAQPELDPARQYSCAHCSFDNLVSLQRSASSERPVSPIGPENIQGREEEKTQLRRLRAIEGANAASTTDEQLFTQNKPLPALRAVNITELPDELLLKTTDYLEIEDIILFAQSWQRLKTLIQSHNVIRCRELQCFVLKKTYKQLPLGIGVSVSWGGKLQSEFDLISGKAFDELAIRRSIHGFPFTSWLPLPLSYPHWRKVHPQILECLTQLKADMNLPPNSNSVNVILAFMNEIVVRFSQDLQGQRTIPHREDHLGKCNKVKNKRTLRHASEKAVESYFQLYHILLCVATGPDGKAIVAEVDKTITSFLNGKRSKSDVPNLGHLLTALLISDVTVTVALRKAIITEAITRNVVWLLDAKGAGFAELGFLEEDEVSYYRLKKTFQGGRTSYRLLMFSELFRRTVRPSAGSGAIPKKSLVELRDALFNCHGSPPDGTVARLASEVRRLQEIDEFPSFLREMGLKDLPDAKQFTTVLRNTVSASVSKGYSRGVPQETLARLRFLRDWEIDVDAAISTMPSYRRIYSGPLSSRQVASDVANGTLNFFPGPRKNGVQSQQRRAAHQV